MTLLVGCTYRSTNASANPPRGSACLSIYGVHSSIVRSILVIVYKDLTHAYPTTILIRSLIFCHISTMVRCCAKHTRHRGALIGGAAAAGKLTRVKDLQLSTSLTARLFCSKLITPRAWARRFKTALSLFPWRGWKLELTLTPYTYRSSESSKIVNPNFFSRALLV